MNANLLRNALLSFIVAVFLGIGLMAYGNYKAINNTDAVSCCVKVNNRNAEMPWESVARQLIGAVAL